MPVVPVPSVGNSILQNKSNINDPILPDQSISPDPQKPKSIQNISPTIDNYEILKTIGGLFSNKSFVILRIGYFLSAASFLDNICWVLPFAQFFQLRNHLYWAVPDIFFALMLQFMFPTNLIAIFLFNKWHIHYPLCFMITCKIFQLGCTSLMLYSFYSANMAAFTISRVILYMFYKGNSISNNHMTRILQG